MSTFKPIGLATEMFQGDVGRLVASAAAKAPGAGDHPVTFSAFREIPRGLFGSLAAGRSQVTFRTPYLDNDLVELAFRAPAPSRQSPDAALKLVIDHRHALSRIPTDRGIVGMDRGLGHLMRRIYAEVTFKLDYLHKEGLPTRLAPFDPLLGYLSKTGVLGLHKYLPFRLWYRRELSTYIRDVLTDERTSRLPYFSRTFIDSMLRDHIGGTRNYVREINAVLTLEAADRLIVRAAPARVPDRVVHPRFAAPVKVRTAR
jgi:asparagine synthase (glutamine-hydrolysing)